MTLALLTRTDSHFSDISNASLSESCESSYISTECGTTSDSSTSTVPGPGALTGKAIKALGVATLRSLGRFIMARHLAVVAHSFPHTDEEASQIQNISTIYEDLLEFSRPGMYNNDISRRALSIILSQIGAGQTRYLIKALSRWHHVELHILLTSVMMQLSHLWNPLLRSVFSSPLSHSYTDALCHGLETPALRLVLFLSKVIRIGSWACKAVLDVGFLEVLMSLNHHHRFASSNANTVDYHLYIACNASLLDVTGYLEYRDYVKKHPISSTWPVSWKQHVDVCPFKIRREVLLMNLESDVRFDEYSPFDAVPLKDICARPCISNIPAEELLHGLTFEVTYDQALRVYLSRNSHLKKAALLSDLIQCLSRTMLSSIADGRRGDPRWRYQFSFSLYFVSIIARSDPSNRDALIDAGAIDYITNSLQIMMPDAYVSAMGFIRDYGSPGAIFRGLEEPPSDPGMPPSIFSAISALLT